MKITRTIPEKLIFMAVTASYSCHCRTVVEIVNYITVATGGLLSQLTKVGSTKLRKVSDELL